MTLPLINASVPIRGPLSEPLLHEIEKLLPDYLQRQRWFGGKARELAQVQIEDVVRCPARETDAHLLLMGVMYADGERRHYTLPITVALGDEPLGWDMPDAVLGRVADGHDGAGCLVYDATCNPSFGTYVLTWIADEQLLEGATCRIVGERTAAFDAPAETAEQLDVKISAGEQSNTSIVLGRRLILKLYRQLEEGESPELEMGRFLTERTSFRGTPAVAGALTLRRPSGEPATLAVLHQFVPNQGDTWSYTLGAVRNFLAAAEHQPWKADPWGHLPSHTVALAEQSLPEPLVVAVGQFVEDAQVLGRRTGEMHLALASQKDDPRFAPEPLSPADRAAALESAHHLVRQVLGAARAAAANQSRGLGVHLKSVLDREEALLLRFDQIWGHDLNAQRIRCHGDYHLGQILRLDGDFCIIDFEGEPARSIPARKRKDSPLRDVAGLLRSFHYAANAALVWSGAPEPEHSGVRTGVLADAWYRVVVSCFLRSYLDTCRGAGFLPSSATDLVDLLDAYLLEKAVYEIGYELNNRPEWVGIPVAGLLQLLP